MASFKSFFKRMAPRREGPACGLLPPSNGERQKTQRILAVILGVLVSILAAYLATEGLSWSTHFHPDERNIEKWMEQVLEKGYITDRPYPSGWFELYRLHTRWKQTCAKLAHHWEVHSTQDGSVRAVQASSYFEHPCTESPKPTVQDGRDFNAWLYVLTCIFLYAACLEMGFRPWAAFVSALFFLASPPPLEFLHYCETDAGLMVSMAFFAWLSARTIRKNSPWLVVVSGFVAGFSISCKPSLFPILLWIVVAPILLFRSKLKSGPRWIAICIALVLCGALAAALGYLAGTPALRLAPDWYLKELPRISQRTYDEICVNLGGPYSWKAASVLRAGGMVRELGRWGVLPLLWGIFAWTFWFGFKGRFRRQAMGLPILLPFFIPFLVFCCPFVRRQELLPLCILFALGAGLPVEWFFSAKAERHPLTWKKIVTASLVAVLGTTAFLIGAANALGMSSCFRMRDTRAQAQNWLYSVVPDGLPLGYDTYVGQAALGIGCKRIPLGGLPYFWNGQPQSLDGEETLAYYIENTGFEWRYPIRSLKTSALLPDVRDRIAAYRQSVLPLRTWSMSTATPHPTFGQPNVRLVTFDVPSPTAFDIPVGYSRPILLIPDGAHLYDADGPGGLGAFRALHTVGKRSFLHLKLEDGPRWLVTRMLEGDASVRIVMDGLFSPEKSDLPIGGAVAATLRPGLWERITARAAAYSTTRCRMRGDDQSIVCASYLTPSPGEAARELRLAGNPAGALTLLEEAGTPDDEARIEAFLAAAAVGIEPKAEWSKAARAALEACHLLKLGQNSLGRTDATLCGVPLGVHVDFSRLRTGEQLLEPGKRLPIWLPPGHYEATVVIPPGSSVPAVPPRLFELQTADFVSGLNVAECPTFSAPLNVQDAQMLRLSGADNPVLFSPFAADIEISWSPVERTLEAAEALRHALESEEKGGCP